MDNQLRLVGFPPSTFYQTAALCLVEKGLAFERVTPMDPRSQAGHAPHPFRRVPSLHHGEVTIHECLAIACYVDCAFNGPSLIPTQCQARALTFEWVSNYLDYGVGSVLRYSVRERFQKKLQGLVPDEELIRANKALMLEFCKVLNEHLRRLPWLSGENFSIADMFHIPALHYFSETPEGREILAGTQDVWTWLKRCHLRDSVKNVCGPLVAQ